MLDDVDGVAGSDIEHGKPRARAPLAFLAAAQRVAMVPGRTNRARCEAIVRGTTRQCGHLAMTGLDRCRVHSPWHYAQRLAAKARAKALAGKGPHVAPDVELTRLPVWRLARGQRQRNRLALAWSNRESDPAAWRAAIAAMGDGSA